MPALLFFHEGQFDENMIECALVLCCCVNNLPSIVHLKKLLAGDSRPPCVLLFLAES